MATATLRPAADGTYDTWTLTGGTAGSAYTTIDESVADDTDYISSNDTTSPYDKQSVTLGTMPEAASISSVVIHWRSRSAFANGHIVPFYRSAGVDTEDSETLLTTTDTEYTFDITASESWTTALVNAVEIGWRKNNVASNTVRVTQAWLAITYLPPVSIPPGLIIRPVRTVNRLIVRRV